MVLQKYKEKSHFGHSCSIYYTTGSGTKHDL